MGILEFIASKIQEKAIDELYEKNKKQFPDEIEHLKRTLREAGYIAFAEEQPAKLCMERFLSGAGGRWEFDLQDLLSADKGARNRIESEAARRAQRHLTLMEKFKLDAKMGKLGTMSDLRDQVASTQSSGWSVQPKKYNQMIDGDTSAGLLKAPKESDGEPVIDPIITIFQKNYSTLGWWGALGTFPVRFERVSVDERKKRVFVRLTGSDEYRWHAEDESRITVRLHQFGQRLVELGAAKNFTMVAKPKIHSLPFDVGDHLFQINQQGHRPGGMIDRAKAVFATKQ